MSEWIIVTMILAFIAERVYKWRIGKKKITLKQIQKAAKALDEAKEKRTEFDINIGDRFYITGSMGPMAQTRIDHSSIEKFFDKEDELFLFYSHAEVCNRLYVMNGDYYYAEAFEVENLIFAAEKLAETIKEKREA